MDPVTSLITGNKIPIGKWCQRAVLWMQDNIAFDPLSDAMQSAVAATADVLLAPPPPLLIAAAAVAAAVWSRSWRLPLLAALALGCILNQGYWEQTMQTLACILWASALCMAVGVPFGVFCARRPRAYRAAILPVLDMMQTMPTFVYLIPMLALFGLGFAPGLIATVIFAAPAVVRLTYLGIAGAPQNLTEVGRAFGATKGQILRRVELPNAIPSIMAGMTQCIMLSLSMVVIAALVGTPGLGTPVVRALNTGPRGVALGFEAGLCIVALAILLDRFCRRGGKQ